MQRNQSFSRDREMLTYLGAGLVASLVVVLALAELHRHVALPSVHRWDTVLQGVAHGWASPRMTMLMRALTWIGSPLCVVPLCAGIALLLWPAGDRHSGALLLCSMFGAAVLALALKAHFKRVRPDVSWSLVTEHSYSFPSGHSMMAVVLYGTLLYLFLRRLRSWWWRAFFAAGAFALAAGIGVSRVYLGAHYPSDVAGGYFCGTVWLVCVVGADLMVRRELPLPRRLRR